MRRVIAQATFLLLLCSLGSFSFGFHPVKAQETPTLRVTSGVHTVDVGQTFIVNVTFENMPATPGEAGFQFNLTWGASILQGISMEDVIFHTVTPPAEWSNIWTVKKTVLNGTLEYGYTWLDLERAVSLGYAPISGNGTVATIRLKAVAAGYTILHFARVVTGDLNGNLIPTTRVDMRIDVTEQTTTRYAWSMFHADLGHTGFSDSPAPGTNRTRWNCTTGGEVRSSPAVAAGTVFIGSNDSKVYALDQYSGEQKWSFTTGGEVQSSPAVADGKVYVGSFDRKVYCLDAATGTSLWSYTTGGTVFSSPAVASGRVYVGSWDNKVYCLPRNDPDSNGIIDPGEVIWTYTTGGWITSSPAVVEDKVYFGSLDGRVYCLDALTGSLIWNYATGSLVLSSPAVADGKVYVGSDDGKIYCLKASNGNLTWSYTTGNKVRSSPAVTNGKVYAGSDDGQLYCLDALNGASIWNYTTGNWMQSSPAVADGKVYVGSFDGKINCLNASTGQVVWSYVTGIDEWSSPAVADGIVYVGSGDHTVYAFGYILRVPEDYPTVRQALEVAVPGATVWIAPGTYNESVVIDKPVSIIGKKGSAPIFSGGGVGIAITLLASASGSIIAGLVISNWDKGILIHDASDCKIYDNIISLVKDNGIILEGTNAAHNLVYCNIFERNTIGINLTSSSSSDIFLNVFSLSNTGICLGSSGNTIYANTISQNIFGINMTNSNNNKIYNNNFEGNTLQLSISTSTGNIWDDGYPTGGNYWSNNTGPDLNSGPYQNETGSDGIIDVPYVIAGNNIDNYPLAQPFSIHNIGITSPTKPKTVVGQSFTMSIHVKIQNQGMYDETFTLTVSINTTVMDKVTVSVTVKKSVDLGLNVNTSRLPVGNYTVSVATDTVSGETEISDNAFNCSLTLTIPGDIKGDFVVDIYDAIILAGAYNSVPTSFNWNANADINNDNVVDIYDAIILAGNYGKTA